MTEDQRIEAAAEVLRQLEQGGKQLNPWGGLSKATKRKWCDKVRTTIAAYLAGDVVVPREASEEIVNAAIDKHNESPFGPDGYFALLYRAMIAAAHDTPPTPRDPG